MEQKIKNRFSDSILQQALRLYDIDPQTLKPLDGFESFIYEFKRGEEAFILRINHSSRRSKNMIRGEVDWINYLVDGGVSASKAVVSQNNVLLEAIADGQGENFLATAFVKAEGKPARDLEWTPTLYETYGRTIGRMHALTQDYIPSNEQCTRLHWKEDYETFYPHFPDSEAIALGKFKTLIAHLKTLPQSRHTYGITHADAHAGNFFVTDSGKITLFDFDDSVYHWFAHDIAIVLFYQAAVLDNPEGIVEKAMIPFLKGYRAENRMAPIWLKEIANFLKLRELALYAVIHRSFGGEATDNAFCQHFMKGRKHRIETDVPFLNFDFESLASQL